MKTLDITKPVKLRNPQPGEENIIFKVTNYNEVHHRCYIMPITPILGKKLYITPQELVSADEIENV